MFFFFFLLNAIFSIRLARITSELWIELEECRERERSSFSG